MHKFFLFVLGALLLPIPTQAEAPSTKTNKTFTCGWYEQDPYQYIEEGRDGILKLTGLDPELTRAVISYLHGDVLYQPLPWYEHKNKLIQGEISLASGVTKTEKLDEHTYYSDPYRLESTGLFTLKNAPFEKNIKTPEHLIKNIQDRNFRLGVVKGFVQTDPTLNTFINNPDHTAHIFYAENNKENLRRLLNNEIDGFLADRLSGATLIWREGLIKQIAERPLGKSASIHLAFSKKNWSEKDVETVNHALKHLKKTGRLDTLFSKYVQPLIMLQTLNSDWFFIIELIGTIAFAVSGIILAYKDGATYFGTFIYAMLPSAGGGILRDLLLNRHEVAFLQSPIYILLVLATTLMGIILLKLFFHPERSHENKVPKVFELIFFLSDTLGLASFCVLGVVVAMVMHASPLIIWGPFMAFLTGAGGGILRDIIRGQKAQSLHGQLYPEVAVFWGFLLSYYLTSYAQRINQEKIQLAMIFTLTGVFLSRLFIRQLGFKNFYVK